MTELDRGQILAHRYRASGLAEKRPAGRLADSARPGLQDSAPRSGVLSLHARTEAVTVDDWSDGRLTQVWGPRGAIYLIPKEDLGVFTLGLLPRDEEQAADLNRQARRVLRMLDGRPQSTRAILEAVPTLSSIRELLWTATTGWYLPIWDAAATAVYPAEPSDADPEESRIELGRRFLHYLGPSTTKGLQWWTGSSDADAVATMAALGPELATVTVDGEEVLMLADDVSAALSAPAPEGLHLLPPDDLYINRLCGALLLPDATQYGMLYPHAPLPGAIVVDGAVVGVWRRRRRRFMVTSFAASIADNLKEQVADAARALPLPGDPDETVVDWDGDL